MPPRQLIQRSGELTQGDMVVGVLLIVLVFEAARRVMGIALPIICSLFLAYGLLGEYLPGDLAHRGYGVDQIVNQLSFGTEGLYGTPTYVSATYIYLFILFGAFLEQAGMIRLFTDFAMGLFGRCSDKMKMQGMVDKPGRTSIHYTTKCPDGTEEQGLFWATEKALFVATAKGQPGKLGPTDAFLYGFEAK